MDKLNRPKKEKRKFRIFATVNDVGVLIMCLIYVVYIAVLYVLNVGVFWLNIAMASLTGAYFFFVIAKLVYLNARPNRVGRIVGLIYKYSRYLMRLINTTILVISIVSLGLTDDIDLIMVVGIAALVVMLTISLAWDLGMIVIRRKIREFRNNWENLPPEEKHDKLELLIKTLAGAFDRTGELGTFLLEFRGAAQTASLTPPQALVPTQDPQPTEG